MVNDSQALILFTWEKPARVLMFKLPLMRQTLFDFDVLLPRSCVAAFFLFFFLSFFLKKKPRKMFRLRLSQ